MAQMQFSSWESNYFAYCFNISLVEIQSSGNIKEGFHINCVSSFGRSAGYPCIISQNLKHLRSVRTAEVKEWG